MATPQYFDIGGGNNDYSSVNAWEAAERANLVAADKIYVVRVFSGSNCLTGSLLITSGTWVTDATRYIEIIAATGDEHTGVWSTSKAYGQVITNGTVLIQTNQYVHLTKMQFRHTNAGDTWYVYGTGGGLIIDRCFFIADNCNSYDLLAAYGPGPNVYSNTILIANGIFSWGLVGNGNYDSKVYNCTFITTCTTGTGIISNYWGGTLTSQNNYMGHIGGTSTCYRPAYGGAITKGANDATYNTEAITAALRSIPCSAATFFNVTPGSENLRLVVSQANKLIDNGANLTGQGVTTDIIGTARPQLGAFDIGAFENDTPICWNYTARYRNSAKLFKRSGLGVFPRNLNVPNNVDRSTGRMIDDGIEIDPNEYTIL